MIHFNLINDGWIPVSSLSSREISSIGVKELLRKASEYQCVQGDTPLETAAIYRLLIAFVHAAYADQDKSSLSDLETWRRLWLEEQRFDGDIIDAYCNKYQSRFNLFDDARPFYQHAKLTGKVEPVSSLMGHVSSGADATLFNHNTKENSVQLSLGKAARAIVTIHAFGLAGTKGSTSQFGDAPCARGVMFFVEGDNLFETLFLNLFERDLRSHRLKYREEDRPVWELGDAFASSPKRPYGLLDHLTWQNRRILLIEPKGENEQIAEMIYAPGLKSSDVKAKSVREVFNPFYHWNAKTDDSGARDPSERSHSPIVFREGKALWRDSATLFELPLEDEGRDKPPAPLTHVRILADEGVVPRHRTYRLLAIGACTESGRDKTFFYRAENLLLPLDYLDERNASLVSDLANAISLAEKVGKLLNRCAFLLAWLVTKPTTPDQEFEEPGKPFDEQTRIETKYTAGANERSKDQDAQKAYKLFSSFGVERLYWSGLETQFYRFLQDLPSEPEEAKEEWRKQLRRAARATFKQATDYAGADRRALRAVIKAQEQFDMGVGYLLNVKTINSNQGGDSDGK
ncbi:MAG: type I-E CRISPR-associated protein Cse1/CasA [Chloroflexota bacterium]|nr:MAG: type I-E CRISPR-associated protein Cse1/CasA [Chloroflexota bacterium]